MYVAVIGSWRTNPPKGWETLEHWEQFQLACIHIGSVIAKVGCTLLTPTSQDEETAEYFAYKGFVNRMGKDKGIYIIRDHDYVPARGAAHILAVHKADMVILIGGTEAAYNAAISTVKIRKRLLVLPAFGGAARAFIRRFPPPKCTEIGLPQNWRGSPEWLPGLVQDIEEQLLLYPRILIIHGRSQDRYTVKNLIQQQKIPGLAVPIIMEEHGHGAPQITELFEQLARKVDAAIVLATPDDIGSEVLDENGNPLNIIQPQNSFRARQNVWLEVGWFWGTLGFDRLLILVKKNTEIPSDFSGVRYHKYDTTPFECKETIVDFINYLREKNGKVGHP